MKFIVTKANALQALLLAKVIREFHKEIGDVTKLNAIQIILKYKLS
jgi:hypothetical protein